MQTELQNGFDKDKVIADLQAKLLASDEKTSEPLVLHPPSLFGTPLALPTAPIQPSTDQRSSADKSLTQIKQFFRDRSPEISDPMIVSDDSASDDENEKPDLQFILNQRRKAKAKRKSSVLVKEEAKAMMRLALERQQPWKCRICSSFFRTSEELHQHIKTDHKDQKHFCNRCPFSYKNSDKAIKNTNKCITQMTNSRTKLEAESVNCAKFILQPMILFSAIFANFTCQMIRNRYY